MTEDIYTFKDVIEIHLEKMAIHSRFYVCVIIYTENLLSS